MDSDDRVRLFVKLVPELRRFARRLVPDDPAALDDLVQDVAIKVLEHPHGPGDEASFSLWCRGVARHLCMHRRRSFARHATFREAWWATSGYEGTERFERALLARDQLAAGMSRLDRASVRLLFERYFDGATSSEIAARWQVSAASVRMRLARLRSDVCAAAGVETEGDLEEEAGEDEAPTSGERLHPDKY
jgi:RNA polymerase sigma factor (sigma-70 family)